MIAVHAHRRRLGGRDALSPSDPAVAAVATVAAAPACLSIVRVRLAPDKPRKVFEWQLRAIPAVLSAVHVIGDVDYELRLACRDVADLGAVLISLRGCGGAVVVSTELVLGEVPGLGQRGPSILDGGARPRPRTRLSACPAWRPASGPAVRAWSPTVRSRSAACG
jgi:DNA-binding Lrp family transcriptional regulator